MEDRILSTLDDPEPPAELSPPLKALWWLRKGDLATGAHWERAHEICQEGEGQKAYDWVHALAHRIEGDTGNAGYWYRRAGETPSREELTAEWAMVVGALSR